MARKKANDAKYLDSFEKVVREHLSVIQQQSANIELYIEKKAKEERDVSNKSYAPYLAWTLLLSILGVFGMAVALKLTQAIGL